MITMRLKLASIGDLPTTSTLTPATPGAACLVTTPVSPVLTRRCRNRNGRTSPNVNRNFDLPFIGFSALGQPDNGRLPTDRPHVFKLSGAYAYDWSQTNTTEVSGFTTIQSGTPVSTRFTLFGVAGSVLEWSRRSWSH